MRAAAADQTLIASHSARIMCSILGEGEFDVAAILDKIGLSLLKIEDPDCQITIRQELELQRIYASLTESTPGQWYRTGLRYGVLSYGSLGQASLCTGSVGHALALFISSFQDLNYSLLHYRLVVEGARVVAIETSDESVQEDLWRFSQERSLGSVERIMHDLAPGMASFDRIESALRKRPAWLDQDMLNGVPISFGHARSRWYLTAGLAERALPMANGVLESTYRRLCEKLIDRMNSQANLVSRLYFLLLHADAEKMTMKYSAHELCIHERTLQRKLAESGLTFSDLVGQVREQRSKLMLRTTDMTIGQIAQALGFNESAAFSHAFKRWTGQSPLDFRKLQRSAQ